MADTILLFEDDHVHHLLPLVYFRPVYDLRCGITTLREKVQQSYPDATVALHCRSSLAELVRVRNPDLQINELNAGSCLLINGRALADDLFSQSIPLAGSDAVYMKDGSVIAARVSGKRLEQLVRGLSRTLTPDDFSGLPEQQVDISLINYPWELVGRNGEQIVADITRMKGWPEPRRIRGKVYDGALLVNRENIYIDEGAVIKPGTVLDAEEGPVYIGRKVKVFPNATIEGPAYVGDGTMIKIGAKIYENTSIGEMCKVGGEVEESVIHSYSNKQHDGFLGHAYLGMWVNLGADTNNSDLKNNYSNVRVILNGKEVDTGSMFVGLIMGDHSKSGINTMFNTGTVVGVGCNIFGGGYPPKYIPSFCWGGSDSLTTYDIDRCIGVARRVMARRKQTLSSAEESLFRNIFESTADLRSDVGIVV
jgi:UDP-N-acetylglucosamine diphosphorylase/glucosamine-1-phosphate N-acetyltransferase